MKLLFSNWSKIITQTGVFFRELFQGVALLQCLFFEFAIYEVSESFQIRS